MESGGVYFLLAHVLGSRVGTAFGLLYVFGQVIDHICFPNIFQVYQYFPDY
jgi:potassium/chloride transporter 8